MSKSKVKNFLDFTVYNSQNEEVTYTDTQLGGGACAQWCCDMIICNTILNCCCSCR